MRRPSPSTRALLIVFASIVSSCRNGSSPTEKDEAARAEAGHVARQVKLLRDADNAQKPVLLKALDQTPCTLDGVCAVKRTCSEAYTLQETALDALSAVRHALQGVAPGMDERETALLSQAEAALTRAKELTTKCADLEAALRRQYRF